MVGLNGGETNEGLWMVESNCVWNVRDLLVTFSTLCWKKPTFIFSLTKFFNTQLMQDVISERELGGLTKICL